MDVLNTASRSVICCMVIAMKQLIKSVCICKSYRIRIKIAKFSETA